MEIRNAYGQVLPIRTNIQFDKVQDKQKAVFILCHGFLANYDMPPIDALYRNLCTHNQVLAFNFIGEGRYFPSFSECTKDLLDVITFLEGKGFSHLVLIGHSMGAAVAACITPRIGSVYKLVLISMPYDLKGFRQRYHIPTFKQGEIYKEITIKGTAYQVKKEFIEDTYRYSIEKSLKDISIPVLIIHGAKDTHLPSTNAKLIYKALFSTQPTRRRWKHMKIIQGAGHLFTQKKYQQSLYREIESFLIT